MRSGVTDCCWRSLIIGSPSDLAAVQGEDSAGTRFCGKRSTHTSHPIPTRPSLASRPPPAEGSGPCRAEAAVAAEQRRCPARVGGGGRRGERAQPPPVRRIRARSPPCRAVGPFRRPSSQAPTCSGRYPFAQRHRLRGGGRARSVRGGSVTEEETIESCCHDGGN